jgi:hypothetical protein
MKTPFLKTNLSELMHKTQNGQYYIKILSVILWYDVIDFDKDIC